MGIVSSASEERCECRQGFSGKAVGDFSQEKLFVNSEANETTWLEVLIQTLGSDTAPHLEDGKVQVR